MIEMRENRYDDLRKTEVERVTERQNMTEVTVEIKSEIKADKLKDENITHDPYRDEEYNPWS